MFFVPTNIEHLRFSDLPTSADLRTALRKMSFYRLADLNGVTSDDFRRVSRNSSKLMLELDELISAVRIGNSTSAGTKSVSPTVPVEQPSIPENPSPLQAQPSCQPAVVVSFQHNDQSDQILIHEEVKARPLSVYPMSVRLAHILEFKHFRQFGDLHGLSFGEFRAFRNCGKKTVNELRGIVNMAQQVQQSPNGGFVSTTNNVPVQGGCFFIAENAYELNPFELPLTARLERVLEKKGIIRLGDLHGVSVSEFRRLRNCGGKTVAELIRLLEGAAEGKFSFPLDQKVETRLFAEHLDAYLGQLEAFARNAVLFRYGATLPSPLTLEAVGRKLYVTRERVRQVCALVFQKLMRAYGLKMRQLGAEMDLISRAEQRPIEWRDIAFKERRYAYREKFYCRALKEVFPELSVAGIKEWNARQVLMAYGREIKEIEQKAELLLGNYTVEQAYQDFSLKFGNVNLVEFDEMLIQSGRLRIQHGKKNGAVIYPRLLNRLNFLRGILERSTKPLSSRKIHTEFKAMHIVHGFKNYPGVRRIHSLLSETPGIFYFGKSTFGLEKHLHVNCTHWPTLVREFEGCLRQNQKPTSTNEFLKFHREWGDELTAQELADILRQVGGLTDLGRQLFALPEWRLSKREKIVDIIRQALTSASTPLSEEHLIEAVTHRRSAFIQTFAGYLEKIPEMFRYGGGYCGLTPPSENIYEFLFGQEHFFDNVLRRRQPPILVENLWCEFGFESTHTPIQRARDASTAWKTIRLLSQHDGIEVFHTGWSIRRLLVGIIRSASHPMSRHEVEWEIKERYTGVLKDLNEKRMRELLKYDPLFIEDAAGNLMCSDSLDKIVPQVDELSERAVEIVVKLNRVAPSEDILDRLQAEGFETKEITEDILAMLLRQSPYVKEVGHGWFQPAKN
jgi:hypothetical protein